MTATPNRNRVNLISDRGDRFSYFHCEEFRLGGGAMGEVFKGWRTDNPSQKVAIKKVYSRHADHPHIRRRARYEASLSINHPNLVKMLGYCEFENTNGPIFIVSELVSGTTINKFITNIPNQTKVDIISRMICSVLDALTCLHSLTPPVFHRDIKPSNIMIENGCNVRLMDLGIATSEGVSMGTSEGIWIGTYPYTPPEQVKGRKEDINATSDIYSLGITFYELLTNKNPFAGGSDIDIMEKQLTMKLPYDEQIPKNLFRVLRKATEKEQANRYQTAQEFKEALIAAQQPQNNHKWIHYAIVGGVILFVLLLLMIKKVFL